MIMMLETECVRCVRELVFVCFLLEQQHMKMSFLWTEVDFSDLAASPAGYRGALHDPGCVAEATTDFLDVCVTNTCPFPSASVDREHIASWCGTHRGWLRHISFSFCCGKSFVFIECTMTTNGHLKHQKPFAKITAKMVLWVVLFMYVFFPF